MRDYCAQCERFENSNEFAFSAKNQELYGT